MRGYELRVRDRQQTSGANIFQQVVRVGVAAVVLPPRSVAHSVRIACICEVGPSGHEMIRESPLGAVERGWGAGRSWAPVDPNPRSNVVEQLLDVGRVLAQGLEMPRRGPRVPRR